MPLTKPTLTKATPGLPLTAGGWNAVVDGVGGIYDGLSQVDRDYMEISITFRGQPVGDARVVGVPVDPSGKANGPALAAVPPVGDITSYQLVGITPGTWNIAITAAGFEPVSPNVQVATISASGPSASTQVELKRTTVPVPDLVGLQYVVAFILVQWTEFGPGIWNPFIGTASTTPDSYVVFQGPSDGEAPLGAGVSVWFTGTGVNLGTNQKAWRTVVPDLRGWPGADAYNQATSFQLTRGQETGSGGSGTRVIAQNPPPGQIVAPMTAFDVSYSPADDQTKFGLYPATHAALATTLVKDVQTALYASTDTSLVELRSSKGASPWSIVRPCLSDATLKALLDFFGQFKVTVSAPSTDLPAIWASFVVAMAASQPV